MSYNGSGVFQINSAGQPVVNGTTITSVAFNALTADIATGLSTAITKDGQTTVTANIPMSSFKFTGLAAGTANGDSIRYEQLTASVPWGVNDFRLSLVSGTPVTTTDSVVNTLFLVPYRGTRIALYDGSSTWTLYNTAQIQIVTPGGFSQMYDVFVYANAGVPTLELLAWTNDTTRATALTYQNGVLVKTGATTRRYVGSVRTTAAGNFEDSVTRRHVWNYYNRVKRYMRVNISSTGYTYTNATTRQAAGNVANQIDLVIGVSEDSVSAEILGSVQNTTAGTTYTVGVGLDSTTAVSTDTFWSDGLAVLATSIPQHAGAKYLGYPGVGRHTLTWLESSTVTGTTTWNSSVRNCIVGEFWA